MSDQQDLRIRSAADPSLASVYDLAAEWRDRCLRDGRSLFAPDLEVWTPENAAELYRRIVLEPDLAEGSFAEKLVGQLAGASQEIHLLLADVLVIHLLAPMNIGLEKKLELISSVGELAPVPFEVQPEMHQALARGPVNAGVGFLTNRFWVVGYLLAFAAQWTQLDASDKAELLADPWAMKEFVVDVKGERAQGQRNSLLFLLFPDTFEDIASDNHKRRIVEAHADVAGDDPDLDRRLLAAREGKAAEFGVDFGWYSDEVRPTWDHPKQRAKKASAPLREDDALALLRKAFPDDADLRLFAGALVEAIRAAHEVNPAGWTLNRSDGGVAFTAGPNHALGAYNGKTTVLAFGEAARFVGNEDLGPATANPCKAPEGARWVTSDATYIGPILEAAGDDHLAAVRESAKANANVRRYFAEDLVVAVEELEGVSLPRPRLATGTHSQNAWVVRMKREGVSEVLNAVGRGDARVFWDLDVQPGASLQAIREGLLEGDPELGAHRLGNHAGQIHRFITKMAVGDLLLSPDDSDLYVGEITSDARFEDGEWVRDVDWANPSDPIDRDSISSELYSRLRSLLTVTDISDLSGELATLVRVVEGDVEAPTPKAERSEVTLRQVDTTLASNLHLDQEWLEEVVGVLRRRRQAIFFGPPGTGKTYLAEKLANHLVNEAANYRVVQFHPSYSYEDFVEGYRPVVDANGAMSYELKPGPLKQLADEAHANPSEPYVLIIDEINRGNLAKIFGELYYLLEYRDQRIVLQYGTGVDDDFGLPKNLYVIGTMNTADRSIALVDAAIRRRFGFVEFSPLEAPVGDMLRTWLEREQRDDLPARLLDELNRRLDDRDLAVGPSYLMNKASAERAGLERIWRYEIMPLLSEQFFGRPEAVKEFSLESLLAAVATAEPASETDPETADVDGD